MIKMPKSLKRKEILVQSQNFISQGKKIKFRIKLACKNQQPLHLQRGLTMRNMDNQN